MTIHYTENELKGNLLNVSVINDTLQLMRGQFPRVRRFDAHH